MKKAFFVLTLVLLLAVVSQAAFATATSVELRNVLIFPDSCSSGKLTATFDVFVDKATTIHFVAVVGGVHHPYSTSFAVSPGVPNNFFFAQSFDQPLVANASFVGIYAVDNATGASSAIAGIDCKAGTDGRLNVNDPYVVYAREGQIQVYNAAGKFILGATAADLAALPAKPEENTLIAQEGSVALYKLTTGEFQVNAGPYNEAGDVMVLIFTAFPTTSIYHKNFNIYKVDFSAG